MRRRLALVAAGTALALLALAPSAQGAVRYASPTGVDVEPCSTPATACNLQRAVEQAGNSDEVIVLGGAYNETDQLNVLLDQNVHGQAGQPHPAVDFSGTSFGVVLGSANASLRRLNIEHSGSTGSAFVTNQVVTATSEQLSVRSTGGTACEIGGSSMTLRDTACWTSANDHQGLFFNTLSPATGTSKLRNVTAVATGNSVCCLAGVNGIIVRTGTGVDLTLDAKNVISDGTTSDVAALTDAASVATVTLEHSNYATTNPTGPGTESITPAGSGTNQVQPPLFANAATGDLHLLVGSPTIDNGGFVDLLGTADFDGEPRALDGNCDGIATPDIGADELNASCPPPPEPEPQPTSQDIDPPETTITKAPPDNGEKHKVKYMFVADEPSTFECKADKGDFEPCSSPEKLKVDDGRHKFQVVAIDAAGNADPTPAKDKFKVVD